MRRLEDLKRRILITENSRAEDADALQNDIEMLTFEERQELLAHIHKLMVEARLSLPKTRSSLMWAVNNVRLTVNVQLHF